jgi:D-alanyl-D-alanine-carboxypeptidase/D-alanyl-D-alanine-endopeptidase
LKILTLLFLLIIFGCSHKPKIDKIDGSEIVKEQLTGKIKSLMELADVKGLAISILNNNEVVYQTAFGYKNWSTKDTLNINSIFYGASLSKAVFSILVMQLVEEGKIDLDTPLQNYLEKPLPEYDFNRNWRLQ